MNPARMVLALLLAAPSLVACTERGSGTHLSQTRSFEEPITKVELHGALHATLHAGRDSHRVTLSGDDNIVSLIETERRGDRLVVKPPKSYLADLPLEIVIETRDIDAIEVHGAAHLDADGIDTSELDVELHGASHATLTGRATSLDLDLHGASHIDAKSLSVDEVEVAASGASDVRLARTKVLEGELHGASQLSYRGAPRLDVDTHGASGLHVR